MICPVCGFVTAGETGACPRCSLQQALSGGGVAPEADSDAPRIPGFDVFRPIGRGAMGIVWLARDQRLGRLVALKLIATASDSLLAQRLLREGQAAARLSHPHIVAIHGLGGAGSATYLAMEFHEGGNLDERLQHGPLTPPAAAALAAKLADALAHAHGAGILHRDIKPSNVLLDAGGEPKLADFGLAGFLEGTGDLTRPGHWGGTPPYLAPELLGGVQSASVASEIYGLGALLYVCLTGRPPFVGETPTAVLKSVESAEATAPSVVRPGVPRDLDTITLKCLEKAPARRYGSAEALREDLRRFLDGQPVLARPLGRVQRAARWARRRPAAAAALALGGALIALLAVGGPLVAWRLDRSRQAADDAAATATAIAQFLEKDLLAQSSPDNSTDRDVKLRVVLDRAAAQIEHRFSEQPAVEAGLRQTLGDTYFALGEYAAAQRHLERALALQQQLSPAAFTNERLRAMSSLAATLTYQGHTADGRALFVAVAEQAIRQPAIDRQILVEAANNAGLTSQLLGQFAEGEKWMQRALAVQRARAGADDPRTLTLLNNLISVQGFQGKYDEAADGLAALLAARRRVSGVDNPDTLTVLANLAFFRRLQGRLAEAEALGRDAVARRLRVSGPDHLATALAQGELAHVCLLEHHLPEAHALAETALRSLTKAQGPGGPQAVSAASELGDILLQSDQPAAAEALLQAAVRGAAGSGDWRVAIARSRRGEALLRLRRFAEARDALRTARRDLEAKLPAMPPWIRPEAAIAEERWRRAQAASVEVH